MSNSAFLVLFIVFIAMMGLIPFVLRRFHIPAIVSLLIVGMLIGPDGPGIDLIAKLSEWLVFLNKAPEATESGIQTAQYFLSFVDSLGSLGLIMLMALAGMEADFKLIRTVRIPVISLSISTFLVPAVTGYLVYAYFCPDDLPGKLLYASLFASHSVGIVFPVIRDLRLSKSKFGATVLISTVITDIASIILLAVSVQLFRQKTGLSSMVGEKTLSIFDHVNSSILGNSFMPIFLLIVIAYLVISILSVDSLGKKLLKWFTPSEDILITMILFIIMAVVIIGEMFGINLVVGAFIAGLGMSRLMQQEDMMLFKRFESIGYGFLIPFLFVSIGMKTDFSAFRNISSLSIVVLTVLGLVLSKGISGYLTMKCCRFSNPESLAACLMTIPQLSATLAAAAIGKDLGIIGSNFFNAIIILSIVTTLPIPTLVKFVIGRRQPELSQNHEVKLPMVVSDDELL